MPNFAEMDIPSVYSDTAIVGLSEYGEGMAVAISLLDNEKQVWLTYLTDAEGARAMAGSLVRHADNLGEFNA